MPYSSTDELPDQFSKYGSRGREAAMKAFNSAVERGETESSAFKAAHKAAKIADGEEHLKNRMG